MLVSVATKYCSNGYYCVGHWALGIGQAGSVGGWGRNLSHPPTLPHPPHPPHLPNPPCPMPNPQSPIPNPQSF